MRIAFLFCVLLSASTSLFAQQSHMVSSLGTTVHYRSFGTGEPVLIINGGPGFNSEGFQPLAEHIAGMGYRAILFDQRGTGRSVIPADQRAAITLDQMVADMEAIRSDLGVERWVLLGHSFGGMLANYYASQHPSRVRAMIQSSSGGIDLSLLDGAGEAITSRFSTTELDSLARWRGSARSGDTAARWKYNRLLARAYVHDTSLVPAIAARLMEGDLELNRILWDHMRSLPFDCKESLADFGAPVLIIQGRQDIIPEALACLADEVYPDSRVVLLEHCGHYGWLDREAAYLEAIQSFLSET